MSGRKPIIERAFEIARSGDAQTIYDIEAALSQEGYEMVRFQLEGDSLRRQLREICRTSAKAKADPDGAAS